MTVRNLHPATAELLRKLFHNDAVSWPDELPVETFLQETVAQGMATLVLHRITKKYCKDVPVALLKGLRENALRQAAAEAVLEADLRSLLQAFAEVKMRPLLLKGTALAYSLYREPWLRPRCDTDLLITEAERNQAKALLLRLGYMPLLEAETEYLGSQKSYSKIIQGIRCNYDLHWQISNTNRQFSNKFISNGLFADSVNILTLGKHAYTLNRVDSLIYACFHRAGHFSHSGDRLIWLHDIHLLCQALTEQELEIFCSKVKKLEITTLCADAIAVARSWFNTTLPHSLAALIQEKVAKEAFTSLLNPGGRQIGIKNHALLELKGLPTWRERFLFLFYNAFPPPEFMLWRYGGKKKSSLPLLYLKRLVEAVYIFLKK